MLTIWVLICLFSDASLTQLPHIVVNVLAGSTLDIRCTFNETSIGTTLIYKLNGNTTESRLKVVNNVGKCSLTSDLSPSEVNCVCLDRNSVVCNISGDKHISDNYKWKCATFMKDNPNPFYSNEDVAQKEGSIRSTFSTLKDAMSTWKADEITEDKIDNNDPNLTSTLLTFTSSASHNKSETTVETTWIFDPNTGARTQTTSFPFDKIFNEPKDTLEAFDSPVTTASQTLIHDSFYLKFIIASASAVAILLTATLFTCVYRKYRKHPEVHIVNNLASPENANVHTGLSLSVDHYDRIPTMTMSSIVNCNLPLELESDTTSVHYFEIVPDTSDSDVSSCKDESDGSEAHAARHVNYEHLLEKKIR